MPKQKYSPEFKSKIILAILQGDKEFNVICSEHNLNPNMVHTCQNPCQARMRESLDFAGFYARRWAFVLPKIRLLLANYMQKTYKRMLSTASTSCCVVLCV